MINLLKILLYITCFLIYQVKADEISFTEKHFYINTFDQYLKKVLMGAFGGIMQYLIACSIVEYLNPMPKNRKRVNNIIREIRYAVVQIAFGAFFTMSFYYYIYPYTKYYKYYETHEYGILEFIKAFIVQYIFNKFVGYWTHRMLHIPILYKYIHSYHHSFQEPTCFSYAAAHPLEGLIEGNMKMHFIELIMPVHPIATIFFGFVKTFHALFAHDGNNYDTSDHYRHHLYYVVNYGDPLMDKWFGTAFNEKNFPIKPKCSYLEDFKERKEPIFQRYK